MALLGLDRSVTLYRATGCAQCNHTGYRGRSGIYELMMVDEPLRALVHEQANEQDLRAHASAHGMSSLRMDGFNLVLEGLTTVEEILRVTREG